MGGVEGLRMLDELWMRGWENFGTKKGEEDWRMRNVGGEGAW